MTLDVTGCDRELLTEQKPFEHHRDWNKFLVAVGDEGERPIIPEASCPPALFSLIEDCWRNDVSLRYLPVHARTLGR
jgi:hypothetical protein